MLKSLLHRVRRMCFITGWDTTVLARDAAVLPPPAQLQSCAAFNTECQQWQRRLRSSHWVLSLRGPQGVRWHRPLVPLDTAGFANRDCRPCCRVSPELFQMALSG